MSFGLTYTLQRMREQNTESVNLTRVAGQFATPFTSCPISGASDRVQLIVGNKITEESGAVLIYLDPDNNYDAAGQPATGVLLSWRDDANNLIELSYVKATNLLTLSRKNGGVGADETLTWTFAAGAASVLYAAWDSTTLYLAVNGGTIVSQANSSIPTLVATTLDVGSRGGATQFEGAFAAVVLFSEPLTQDEWEVFAGLTRPPLYGEFVHSVMSGLWYGAHSILYSAPTVIDLWNYGYLTIRTLLGFGMPPVTHRTVETALRDGSSYVDSRLEARRLTVGYSMRGDSFAQYYALRAALAAAHNPKVGLGVLQFANDAEIVEIDAIYDGGLEYASPVGDGSRGEAPQCDFYCPDPLWRVGVAVETVIDSMPGGWTLPWTIPWTITPSNEVTNIVNSGPVATYPEILVYTETDDVTVVDLINQTSGKTLRLAGPYETGKIITINMQQRTIIDEDGESLMSQRTGSMWALEPGGNNVSVGTADGDIRALVRYWPRLLGV